MAILDNQKLMKYFKENTNLKISSIRVYMRTIRKFYKDYKEINLDNLNAFISNSTRSQRSDYVPFALKHLLKFEKKHSLMSKLIRANKKPRKKLGVYLSKDLIKQIILNIKKKEYYAMAMLQYATGARAREIITLKEENIDLSYNNDIIRLRFEGKGGKERISFISGEFRNHIKKYIKGEAGYIFMGKHVSLLNEEDLEITINNERTYYYKALHESALSLGLTGFGTHDFRRNVAEGLRRRKADLRTIQKILGHASINTTARYFDDNPEDIKDLIVEHQKHIENED